jgi:vacuolar-type H+-ATPase subunit I/STV1
MPTIKNDDHDDSPDDVWLNVAQAAERVGVSPRAIQRRCQAGKYQARRIETAKGEQWQVRADSIEGTSTTTTHQRNSIADDADAQGDDSHDERDALELATLRATIERERQERQRDSEQISFLRGLIEQHQRSEAELRQALRKALDAQPRQLKEAGAVVNLPAVLSDDKPSGESLPIQALKAPQNSQKREPRPLWRVILGIR